MWDELFAKKDYKIGQTIRIRLPNDYNLKGTRAMNIMDETEKFKRNQRLECIRLAIGLNSQNKEHEAKKIVNDAKAMYKFVKG